MKNRQYAQKHCLFFINWQKLIKKDCESCTINQLRSRERYGMIASSRKNKNKKTNNWETMKKRNGGYVLC